MPILEPLLNAEVLTNENAFKSTETYVIQTLGTSDGVIATADSDASIIALAFTDDSGNQLTGTLAIGDKIKMASVGDTIFYSSYSGTFGCCNVN